MKIGHILRITCAISALSIPAVADAQDVLVMRRGVTQSVAKQENQQLKPIEGADTSKPYWVVSGWFRGKDQCSAQSLQTRLRGCAFNNENVSEDLCPTPVPPKEQYAEDYVACGYSWLTTPDGEWGDLCTTTTRPVAASCVRETGDIVSDDFCSSQTRPTTEKGFNEAGCLYDYKVGEYGAWKDGCSDSTSRERKVSCTRSDGTNVALTNCADQGNVPATTENGENYQGCSANYNWKVGQWTAPAGSCGEAATETRIVTCVDKEGKPAAASLCEMSQPATSRQEAQSFAACSKDWVAGDYTDWSSTCSTEAKRFRTVSCKREDGQVLSPDECGGEGPSRVDQKEILDGCTFDWTVGTWIDGSTCSDQSVRRRSVNCSRSDGAISKDKALCSEQEPVATETVSNFSNCNAENSGPSDFSWVATSTSWDSTCSDNATRTSTYTCQYKDGTSVYNSYCDIDKKPASVITSENYSGCTHNWAYGEFTPYNSTCSATAKRTRSVSCVQNQPSGPKAVSPGLCDSSIVEPGEETIAIYSGCQATWSYGSWGWNGTAGAKSSTCSATPQQTRTATCNKINSQGVLEVRPDSECQAVKPKDIVTQTLDPDYRSCMYEWRPEEWSKWDSDCSATAKRTRETHCFRTNDNVEVGPGSCNPEADGAKTSETSERVLNCQGLLSNGSFEDDFKDWYQIQPGYNITNDAAVGQKAIRFTDSLVGLKQDLSRKITENQTLTVTYWCKGKYKPLSINFMNGISGGKSPGCPSDNWIKNTVSIPVTVRDTSLPSTVWIRGYSPSSIDDIIIQ